MRKVKKKIKPWTIDSARKLYNIARWGMKYFDIAEDGSVIARPQPNKKATVSLIKVLEEAREKGLNLPVLIRFQDILRHRVESINKAFRKSIVDYQFKGKYRGVFPIKVNQLREVVEEILDAGRPFDCGLEVGSKPELLAALALQKKIGSLIICNGYKDTSFIRMALLGKKLGKRIILVVEKFEELSKIIKVSRSMEIEPLIGIRVRLLCKGAGKWADSGGENAKFGLSTAELLAATQLLKKEGLDHCFTLLHFHIGSQVPDIVTIKRAVQEAARYYAKLRQLGFEIKFMDVGGGLGVDYDGSRSEFESSTNYSLQEYTNDIVYYIGEVCDAEMVPHPDIISESGRAIVAHHSVLVVEVFGAIAKYRLEADFEYGEAEHALVADLLEIRDHLETMSLLEAFHDASERKDEAHNMFMLGMLSLENKAKVEHLYWQIATGIIGHFKNQSYIPEEILDLKESLSHQYLCNFSVFQSLLDHWALDQLFPIMPLMRLNEKPDREATLVDITCDSDGEINKFIDLTDFRSTLPVHSLNYKGQEQEPYFLGLFLMGAYQDIMGDLHNLFGRVNEVHVFLDPDEPDGYYVEEAIEGNKINEVLQTVQYDDKDLKRKMKAQVDAAIKSDRLKPSEGMRLLQDYEDGLKSYTYLML